MKTEEVAKFEKLGVVEISEEVIATIASLAAGEIEGVAKVSSNLAKNFTEMLGMKNFSKGVKVQHDEDYVLIDAYFNVVYGYSVPEVAKKVQENIKNTVEAMTEAKVVEVNAHVEGITLAEDLVE